MSKKLWLILGGILIVIGILKPDLSNFNIRLPVNQPSCNLENYVIDAPSDTELLESKSCFKILKQSDDSTRKSDSSFLHYILI